MTEKPKRPMSAFMLWLNSVRASIKANNPGLRMHEVAKKAGEIWRRMSRQDKQVWQEKSDRAFAKYRKETSLTKGGGGKKAKKRGDIKDPKGSNFAKGYAGAIATGWKLIQKRGHARRQRYSVSRYTESSDDERY